MGSFLAYCGQQYFPYRPRCPAVPQTQYTAQVSIAKWKGWQTAVLLVQGSTLTLSGHVHVFEGPSAVYNCTGGKVVLLLSVNSSSGEDGGI
jgi:hypothetical protein